MDKNEALSNTKLPEENQAPASGQPDVNSSRQLSPEQKALVRIAYMTGCSMLVFGFAGSGKSVLIHAIVSYFEYRKKIVLLAAPTGIAAYNIQGSTIHSLFGLAPTVQDAKAAVLETKLSREKRNLIRMAAVIVIDECSMIRSDLIDMLNALLQEIMRNNLPFGGKQIILVGDFCQLAPFATKPDEKTLIENRYGGYWLFDAPVFHDTRWIVAELTKNFRQVDPEQQEILERFRTGNVDQATIDAVNKRCLRPVPEGHPFPILCSTNAEVSEENSTRYEQLDPATEHVYTCKKSKALDDYHIEQEIRLRIGAKVMMANNDPQHRWVNGTIGTVTGLEEDKIYVTINGMKYQVEKVEFCRYTYEINAAGELVHHKDDITFQLPVRLGWAVTIHRAQGLTLDGAFLAKKSRAFTFAQIYVALSRVRSLDNLWLLQPLVLEEVMTDQHALTVMRNAIAEEQERGYVPVLMENMEVYDPLHRRVMQEIQSGCERILIRGNGASMLGILLGSRNTHLTVICEEFDPQYRKMFAEYFSRYRTVNIRLAEPADYTRRYNTIVDMNTIASLPLVHERDGSINYPLSFDALAESYRAGLESKGCLILLGQTGEKVQTEILDGMSSACHKHGFRENGWDCHSNELPDSSSVEYMIRTFYAPDDDDIQVEIW